MKNRIFALVLTLCLLSGIISAAVPSRAATVYFTAANDTLLELSDATMPFWDKGLLYVPATAFGSGGLGISYSYNSAKKTLTLKHSGYRLICNLSSGMTVDSNGTLYDFIALERNGSVFVPINAVCRIFELSCTTRSVSNGYLVRIRNESASFTDDAFLSAASTMIASRYQDYMASHRQEESTPDPEIGDSRSLYLGLLCRSAKEVHDRLSACSGMPHRITFFLTEEFFDDSDHADAVRRILAEGHGLGLSVSASGADAILALLRQGNDRLSEIACTRTRFVLTDNTSAEEALHHAGYCPVSFDYSCAGEEELSSSRISQLLNKVSSSDRLDLGDSLNAASLRCLLQVASSEGFTGLCFRETAY